MDVLTQIADQLPFMISVVGPDGRYKLLNRLWVRTYGWTLEEITARNLDVIAECYPDPQQRQQVRRFLADPQAELAEFTPRLRDGRILPTTWTIARLDDGTSIRVGQELTAAQQADRRQAGLVAALQVMRAQVRELSRQLLRAHEIERQAIARELHDQIGQELTGIGMMLARLRVGLPTASRDLLDQAEVALRGLMGRVSDLSLNLRPALLDDFGLQPALWWFRERFMAQTGIHIDLRMPGLGDRPDAVIELAAFRIVQEALTNVARHAGVDTVTVRIRCESDALRIQIADQGKGFDVFAMLASAESGGLLGMRERASVVGGSLKIVSAPGAGTQVIASLPLMSQAGEKKPNQAKKAKPTIGE